MSHSVLPFPAHHLKNRARSYCPPRGYGLAAAEGRRVVLVGAVALLAPAARLARVPDLRARDGADVDALGQRLVDLEARRALFVLSSRWAAVVGEA